MFSASRWNAYVELLRGMAIRHRVKLNRIVLVAVLVILSHPRIRVFFAAGFLIALAGATLRLWASLTPPPGRSPQADPSGSQEGREADGLIVDGPYGFVRHPMYLGTAIEAFGVWMACFSFSRFFSFILFGVVLGSYLTFVYKEAILIEEENLAERWPDQWGGYVARTPILFPKKDVLLSIVKGFKWHHLDFSRFERFEEWRNYLACVGVFAFLWFKLIYRL